MSPDATPPADAVLVPAPAPSTALSPEPPPALTEAPHAFVAPRQLNLTPPVFLSAGYIGSFIGGANPATGHGAEASLIVHFSSDPGASIALGPVLQLQNYSEPNHLRFAGGAELAHVFCGLDVLYAYRSQAGDHAGTHGLSLGPYVTLLGIVHVAGRFTIALSPSDEAGFGNEYGITLGLKVPLLVHGNFFNVGHGRPCSIDGRAVAARLVEMPNDPASAGAQDDRRLRLQMDSLTARDRERLTSFWISVAEQEHASIVAFHRLSLALLAAGAPASLLVRAAEAARDEAEHAELARRISENLSARPFAFSPFAHALAPLPAMTPIALALSSLHEGCLAERTAARALQSAARESFDPALGDALTQMARDECAHAELAWTVLEYCLELDREPVAEALAAWLRESAPGLVRFDESEIPRGWGALSAAQQNELAADVWSETVLRVHSLLDANGDHYAAETRSNAGSA